MIKTKTMSATDVIELKEPITYNKKISIVNNNFSIQEKTFTIRIVNASPINDVSINIISGGILYREDLFKSFNFSSNINNDEIYFKLNTPKKTIDIFPDMTTISVDEFDEISGFTANISGYFNNIAPSTFLSNSHIDFNMIFISVNWNPMDELHLYFPNGGLLSTKEYNLNNILVDSWNNVNERVKTGLFIDESILSSVLSYDSDMLNGANKTINENELSSFDGINVPVSACLLFNNNKAVIDTYNNMYIHIVDAYLKNTTLNFIIKNTDENAFRQIIEEKLKSNSYINWINFTDDIKHITNISFSSSSLLNDDKISISFTIGCLDLLNNTSFNLKNEELIFNFINEVNWKNVNDIYVDINTSFDVVSFTCNNPAWNIENDQYTKLIEFNNESSIMTMYEMQAQNTDVDSEPYTILSPLSGIKPGIYSTLTEATLFDKKNNIRSAIADQHKFNINVCSGYISNISGSLYNTKNTLETRNYIPSNFYIDNTFSYDIEPNELKQISNFNLSFTDESWNVTQNIINGKLELKYNGTKSEHIDNIEYPVTAYIKVNNEINLTPVLDFKIIDYGFPVFLSNQVPTFIYKLNDDESINSFNTPLIGYKNDNKEYDYEISINEDILIDTETEYESEFIETEVLSLPPSSSSWGELVNFIPGLSLKNGILSGKITNMEFIKLLQNENSLPYIVNIDDKKIALTIDYNYLSANTLVSEETHEYFNIPSGIIIDNDIIKNTPVSYDGLSAEYNVGMNIYDVYNGNKSLLVSRDNIAKLLYFDYKFDDDYIVYNELQGCASKDDNLSSWNDGNVYNMLNTYNTFGLSSHINYEISGNNLIFDKTSSGFIFENESHNYEALTGEITAFGISKSDFCNVSSIILDTGKVIIPFIPNSNIRYNFNGYDLSGKYYQINIPSGHMFNPYNFIQNINKKDKKDESNIIWKSPSSFLVNDTNDYEIVNENGMIIFENQKVLFVQRTSEINNMLPYGLLNDTFTDYDNVVSFTPPSNIGEEERESFRNICIDDGFYVLNSNSTSSIEFEMKYLHKKCMVNTISYSFGYDYDNNQLIGVPDSITIEGYNGTTLIFRNTKNTFNAVDNINYIENVNEPISNIKVKIELKNSSTSYKLYLCNFNLQFNGNR